MKNVLILILMGKKLTLTVKIIIATIGGIICGILLNIFPDSSFVDNYIVFGIFDIIGQIFINCLKMMVVPLVFVSLVCGTFSLKDIRKIGKIGLKTFLLYIATTVVAICIGLAVSLLVQPGKSFNLISQSVFSAPSPPSFKSLIIDIFPENPIGAMAKANMLQIIVFAILIGLSISSLGSAVEKTKKAFSELNNILLKLVMIVIELAPFGVFCLLSKVFASQGFKAFIPLSKYFFVVLFSLALHISFTYPILLKTLAGLSPIKFYRKFKSVMLFAFTTASSNATIPVTLENLEYELGVNNSIASFTIPLGATINMDGTAIMQGCAIIFIAEAYGIHIGLTGYLIIILTTVLASIGTAGVPGVGLIMLTMVLKQVGLPIEGIGLIIGIDRILDMCRTAVNVTGDGVVTIIVAKKENELNETIFHK